MKDVLKQYLWIFSITAGLLTAALLLLPEKKNRLEFIEEEIKKMNKNDLESAYILLETINNNEILEVNHKKELIGIILEKLDEDEIELLYGIIKEFEEFRLAVKAIQNKYQ